MKETPQEQPSKSHYRFELSSLPDIVKNGDEYIKCKKVSVDNKKTSQTTYYLINYDKKMMRNSINTEKK